MEKIGNGMNIPIFEAPWLRNGGCISGLGQSSEVIQQARVHSLIDHNNHSWNFPVINYYFDQVTVQEILNTPLIRQVEEDRLIWNIEKSGNYSVRSVYRLCMETIEDISHLHRSGNLLNILNLKDPPKVKNLVWRVSRGCIPTRARL